MTKLLSFLVFAAMLEGFELEPRIAM